MPSKKIKVLIIPSVKNVNQVAKRFPRHVELIKGDFENIKFIFRNKGVGITHQGTDLKNFSFVWLSSSWHSRDLAYAIKLYLKEAQVPSTYAEKGTSKITDQVLFSLNKIETPDTLFLGTKKIKKNLKKIEEVCNYPLIIKDVRGSRGNHSVLVSNRQELIDKYKKLPKHKKYLFQKFIPNDYDWGILVANGKVVSGEKSYPCLGEFRNNACNGATEVFVKPKDIPEKIKKMALKASQVLNLSWSRSDIIVDRHTHSPFLMEINRLPGITSKTKEIEGAFKFLSFQIAQSTK